MDVLTASDTLCLSSAAVPGLLNLFVNFRTSDIFSFFSLNVIPSASSLRKATSRHVNLRVWQEMRMREGRGLMDQR